MTYLLASLSPMALAERVMPFFQPFAIRIKRIVSPLLSSSKITVTFRVLRTSV